MTATPRRWVARVLLGLLLALGGLAVTALPAGADECRPDGIPQRAGSGLSGSIDDEADSSTGTKYGEYGWSNLTWFTCDLGDGGLDDQLPDAAKDFNAVLDTSVGNGGLGFATVLAAMMTQLHEWVANPGTFLDPVDSRIGPITMVITDVVWTPYGGAVITLAALFVGVWGYTSGNVRRIGRTLAAILVALLAIAWFSAQVTVPVPTDTLDPETGRPVTETRTVSGAEYSASIFDGIAVEIVGTVDNAILASTGETDGERAGSEEARGAVLQDRLLYRFWAEGATGCRGADTESPACRAAEKLYEVQSVTWGDEAPDVDERRDAYKAAAEELRDEDPEAYQTLRGKDNVRAGTGLFAGLFMVLLAIIRIPAELMILIGLMVVRLVVIMGPLFALAAIIEATRPIAMMALKMVLAAVYNVAVFGVIAAVHSAIVVALMGTNLVVSFVLVTVLTVVTWIVTKPFRSLSRPATGDAVAQQMQDVESTPGRMWGGVKSLAGSAVGSYFGSRAGTGEAIEKEGNTNITNTSNSVTMLNLLGGGGPSTPDTFRRADAPPPAEERPRVRLTTPEPRHRELSEPETTTRSLSNSEARAELPPGPPPAAGAAALPPGSPSPGGQGGSTALGPGQAAGRAMLTNDGNGGGRPALTGWTRPPEPLDTTSIERQVEVQASSQPEQVSRPPVQREVVAGEEVSPVSGRQEVSPVQVQPGEVSPVSGQQEVSPVQVQPGEVSPVQVQPGEVSPVQVQRGSVAAAPAVDPDIFVPRRQAPHEVVITGEVVDVVDEIQVRRSTKLLEPEVTADGSLTTELFRPAEAAEATSMPSHEPVGV